MATPTSGSSSTAAAGWTRGRVLRLLASVAFALSLLALLGVAELGAQLRSLRPPWVVLAALLTLPQLWLCALRWRFTALRLGIPLALGTALREYYLSSLLNQLLPTGVAGDGLRALRHGRRGDSGVAPAMHAVVLERASGQLALLLWTLSAAALWLGQGALRALLSAAAAFLLLLGALVIVARRSRSPLLSRSHAALTSSSALPVQLALSSAVVLTLLAQYQCAAAALGQPLTAAELLRLAPPVLAAMALPISFAGWGVREASSAALFSLAGQEAARGAAVGVVFGVLTLLGSLPGLLFLRRAP